MKSHLAYSLRVLSGAALVLLACARTDDPEAIRKALEKRYEENQYAFSHHDSSGVMGLRHPGFHTVAGDQSMSYSEFAARTGRFLSAIEQFDSMSFHIDSIEVRGDTALAMVRHTSDRRQTLPDGTSHRVQTKTLQREWWIQTPSGWLMWRVDRVQHEPLLIDGQPQS